MNFHVVSVGSPLTSPMSQMDHCVAHLFSTGIEYECNIMNATKHELEQFGGNVEVRAFAVEVRQVPICGVLVRVGNLPWTDATVNASLQPDVASPLIQNPNWNLLRYVFCDTGVVAKLGMVGLWKPDADLLRDTFRKQLERPIWKPKWDKSVRDLYKQYKTLDLLAMAPSL